MSSFLQPAIQLRRVGEDRTAFATGHPVYRQAALALPSPGGALVAVKVVRNRLPRHELAGGAERTGLIWLNGRHDKPKHPTAMRDEGIGREGGDSVYPPGPGAATASLISGCPLMPFPVRWLLLQGTENKNTL